ncbi:MAG: hypothetical protein ACJ0J2_07675 [Dehalococcoidia bacterium]
MTMAPMPGPNAGTYGWSSWTYGCNANSILLTLLQLDLWLELGDPAGTGPMGPGSMGLDLMLECLEWVTLLLECLEVVMIPAAWIDAWISRSKPCCRNSLEWVTLLLEVSAPGMGGANAWNAWNGAAPWTGWSYAWNDWR